MSYKAFVNLIGIFDIIVLDFFQFGENKINAFNRD